MYSDMKHLAVIAVSIGLAFAGSGSVQAQSLDDVVRIEILDGGQAADGSHLAALRLVLADGWKTYWRTPGDAGIPPRFSWRGSQNVGEVSFTWPTPSVFKTSGMRTLGYEDQLILPVRITPSATDQPVRLKGRMELGVCKDICIPSELKFDQDLDPLADRNPAIVAALAARPYSEAEAGVQSAKCRISPTQHGMQVEAHIEMPSAGGTEIAVIEAGNPEIRASEAKTERRGNTLIASSELIHVDGAAYALDRSEMRITVLGRSHAVDIQGCLPG